jgi:hypothetical protein
VGDSGNRGADYLEEPIDADVAVPAGGVHRQPLPGVDVGNEQHVG